MPLVVASSSSSSSSSNNNNSCYDVFLSFRGKDTRYTFTDHLHRALEDAGYHTFRDKEDLQTGENIEPGLENGIQNSRCCVIVFSENYTSSPWCLDELVMIIQHKKTCSDYVVIPIFYSLDPSELSEQNTGKSAEAFAGFEVQFKADIGKVDRWREALKEAANLSGLNLQDEADRYEAEFIEKIVHEVQNKLMSPKLSIPPDLFGIDSQVAELNSWLNDGSKDVDILLICGFPGIGKTTLAKCVYNSNLNGFEGRGAFIDNVSDISRKPNGLVDLQRALLSQLTRGNRKMEIDTVEEGFNRIGEVIRSKRLILVLDDVDQRNQLDAIIGTRDRFYHGSKIIITTSMKGDQLISDGEISKVHVVEPLGRVESFLLFSRHAFGKDNPIDLNYIMLSVEIVLDCDGNPSALKNLGSSLNKKSTTYWENEIENLKKIRNGEILTILNDSIEIVELLYEQLYQESLDYTRTFKEDMNNFMESCEDEAGRIFYKEDDMDHSTDESDSELEDSEDCEVNKMMNKGMRVLDKIMENLW